MKTRRLTKPVLLKAADILNERGLNKGDYEDERTGRVCAYGAIYHALGVGPDEVRVKPDPDDLTGFNFALYDWNDMKSRRKGQVVAKLREMAERAPAR